MVAFHFLQAGCPDGGQRGRHRTMVEHGGRLGGGEVQVNFYAVALLRPQPLAGFIEGKTLLIVVFYDVFQLVAGERVAVGGAGGQQVGYTYPAALLQNQADGLGLVT